MQNEQTTRICDMHHCPASTQRASAASWEWPPLGCPGGAPASFAYETIGFSHVRCENTMFLQCFWTLSSPPGHHAPWINGGHSQSIPPRQKGRLRRYVISILGTKSDLSSMYGKIQGSLLDIKAQDHLTVHGKGKLFEKCSTIQCF